MNTVTDEELADLVGDLGITCELLPCKGQAVPAIAMVRIHHHCPSKRVKQIYAADAACVKLCRDDAPGCRFCGGLVDIVEIIPL